MIHSILGLLGSESGSGRTETELKSLRLFEVKKKKKKHIQHHYMIILNLFMNFCQPLPCCPLV